MFLTIKIVICGDGMVGKTAIRQRYMGYAFKPSYLMTVGADFAIKNQPIGDTALKYQIWDLAGQQRFSAIRAMFYKGSLGALLLYDVTRLDTFENVPVWVGEIKKNVGHVVPLVLVANKVDLRDQADISVSTETGIQLAQELTETYMEGRMEVPYLETSAKTGQNIEESFVNLGLNIIKMDEIGWD